MFIVQERLSAAGDRSSSSSSLSVSLSERCQRDTACLSVSQSRYRLSLSFWLSVVRAEGKTPCLKTVITEDGVEKKKEPR